MAQRTLIRGGHIISMDPEIGDIPGGDLLIEGEEIAAVAPSVEASGCEVVDASGAIVIPGFVDSHRHTWETSARGIAPDVTLDGYFDLVLDRIAPAYRPEDVYAGNLLGALEAVDSGITTLLDWSHINNTPDHADEAIRALSEVGIRAVYCYGNPNTSLADWWFESTLKAPEDIRRVRDRYFSSDKGLMTLAMGTRGPGFCTPEVVRHDWELAREIGVPISVHVGMGPVAGRFRMVEQLHDLGLLGPDTTYIHCNHLTDREFQLIAETGGTVSIAPMVEMTMGHGIPPTGEVLAHGLRPSLSCDVVTSVPGDPFTQMRFLFAAERMRVHQRIFDEELEEVPPLLSSRDVLEFATIEGARVCGLTDRTGSLTPGKKADVVMLSIERVNAAPVTDPVGTVVCSMDTSNVDSVWVNGRALKRGGSLLGFDLERARRLAEDSRDHLVSHVERLPHWATPRTTGL
ncbi:amidohydrolase family protein [Rubrobacter naiadicus]|uniref:amidohydrolase family protein n=1 Tax=Rubrobacter naiadicus TaxID=1392641 RepID=UPI00235F2762|nr:amidohydrolase family protein [Rubrobacter naiadicus]